MRHVLYFSAEWCNPCQRTMPYVQELISEGYHFNIIDADSKVEMVKAFGIKSIPTFILIEDKTEINRMNGAKTKAELIDFLGD